MKGPDGRWAGLRAALPALVVLVLGCTLTFGTLAVSRSARQQRAQEQVLDTARDVTRALNAEIRRHADVVAAAQALFLTSEGVDRETFTGFAKVMNLPARYPALVALSYVEVVPTESAERFVRDQRADIGGPFRIKNPSRDPEHYVVTSIQPARPNEAWLGRDLASVDAVRPALERARDTGRLVATRRRNLPGGTEEGLSLYAPVYAVAAPVDTAPQRRAALRGWVGGSFSAQRLLGLAVQTAGAGDGLALRMYDGPNTAREHLLAATGPADGSSSAVADVVVRTRVFGQDWTLEVVAARDPAGDDPQVVGLLLVVGGLLATVLLAGMVWALGHGRLRAQRAAAGATHRLRTAERELDTVLAEAPVGVAVIDPYGTIRRVNRAFCDLLGRTAGQLTGKDFTAITHAEDPGAEPPQLRRALDGEVRSYQVEKCYLHADGHPVWALLHTTVLRDEDDQPRYLVAQVLPAGDRPPEGDPSARPTLHGSTNGGAETDAAATSA